MTDLEKQFGVRYLTREEIDRLAPQLSPPIMPRRERMSFYSWKTTTTCDFSKLWGRY